MNILYVPSLNVGVCYWRIENYANQIFKSHDNRDIKVHVDYFYDPRDQVAWDHICIGYGDQSENIQMRLQGAFDFFDVVIFQKIQHENGLALISKIKADRTEAGKKNPVIIAEIDDSIGDITPSNLFYGKVGDEHRWAAEHVHMSDAVICSTEYLKKELREIVGPGKPIYVAPNCIDYESWIVEEKEIVKINVENTESIIKRFRKRVGYVGAAGHDEDLLIAYKAMLPILEENKDMGFIIRYGGFRPDWLKDHPQIDFKIVGWTLDIYAQKLYNLRLHLALAPLRDTNFNRSKSNLKWLEWSSLGVQLVASDTLPYSNTNGSMHLSSNDIDEFSFAIRNAMLNPIEPETLKTENKKNYNLRTETGKLLNFIKSMVK